MGEPRGAARLLESAWLHGLLIFALALFLRLESLKQAEATHYPESLSFLDDARYYAHASEAIADGKLIGDHSFFMGPLYPYSLAAVSAGLGLEPILPPREAGEIERFDYHTVFVLQAWVGSLSCLLALWIARRLFGVWSGLLAGLLAAGHGMFIYLDGLLMPSSQVLFLGWVSVACLLIAGERTRDRDASGSATGRWWLASGAALGLSALAKGPALLMLPAVTLWLLVGFPGVAFGDRLRHVARVTFACMALVCVATLHNYAADGDWVLLTSNGGPNFLTGNGPLATGAHAGIAMDYPSAKLNFYLHGGERGPEEPPASQVSRILGRQAWEHMRSDPERAIALFWKKFRMFWNAVEVGTNDHFHFFQRFDSILRLPTPSHGAFAAFGLVGAIALFRRWRVLFPLYAFLITQAGVYTGIFVLGRFRLIATGCLMVFAVGLLAWAWDRLRSGGYKTVLAAVLAVALLLVSFHRPIEGMKPDRGTANQYFLLGRAQDLAGEDPIPAFEAALRSSWREGNSSIEQRIKTHVRLANHAIEESRYADALAHYQAAVDVIPEFSPGSSMRDDWTQRLAASQRKAQALLRGE